MCLPTFQLWPGSHPLSAPEADSAQAGVALCSQPTAGGQRPSSGLPPGVERDNMQRDLSALIEVVSLLLSHTLDILSQALDRLIAHFFSCSLQDATGTRYLAEGLSA